MPHATRPGDVLGDRYRLIDLLTESGTGRFWRGYDRVLGRSVAIHVIGEDDERAPLLLDAARRAARVTDRRALRVLDIDTVDGLCFVVNEWGWGTSLDIVATGSGALGPRRSAWLVSEVADSVARAHAAGVAHGRLVPENVLIDRAGEVRIIGLCVDAALHGIEDTSVEGDLTDLAGLLYCGLTARWGGTSTSIVAAAPRVHGEVMRPRQIRAGIPRLLDGLCDELLHPGAHRHRELPERVRTARLVSDLLLDFVGDAADMPAALLAGTPAVLPEEEQVVLPQVPEMVPHDAERSEPGESPVESPHESPDESQVSLSKAEPERDRPEDIPTEAGVPIFEDDDVSWLERRSTPPPPPPPFEAPPERPLFAAGERRPREGVEPRQSPGVRPDDPFWPWDTGTGRGIASGSQPALADVELDPGHVPGRRFLRMALAVAAAAVLVVAILVAFNLGRGRDALGGDTDTGTHTSSTTTSSSTPGPRQAAPTLTDLVATAFDPLGSDGGSENDELAALAVDGDPATAWTTEGYRDQLGPAAPALKPGVGLVIDLGGPTSVSGVEVVLAEGEAAVDLYVSDELPAQAPGAAPATGGSAAVPPVASVAGGGRTMRLEVDGETTGSYLVVWFTRLPAVDGEFRATVDEVVVHGRRL